MKSIKHAENIDVIEKLETAAEVMGSAVNLIQPSAEVSRLDVANVLGFLQQRTDEAIAEAIALVRSSTN